MCVLMRESVADGLACGMAPMPAPFWLHQLPRNPRWSILFAATYAAAVVGELFSAVGRAVPPQPLREVSMTKPIVFGNPLFTSSCHIRPSYVFSSNVGLN